MHEDFLSELPAESAALLDLGVALGQNHAFGLIAGRCSAAQAGYQPAEPRASGRGYPHDCASASRSRPGRS